MNNLQENDTNDCVQHDPDAMLPADSRQYPGQSVPRRCWKCAGNVLCVSCSLRNLVVFQVYSLQSAVFQVVGIEFKFVKYLSQVTVR